jgi:hypothetical protein
MPTRAHGKGGAEAETHRDAASVLVSGFRRTTREKFCDGHQDVVPLP